MALVELDAVNVMPKDLCSLIEEGRLDELERLLAVCVFRGEELGSAIRCAARSGYASAIRTLVGAGGSVEAIEGHADWKPLHIAVEHGQHAAIRELVRLGADLSSKASGGMTPLHLAVDAAGDAFEQVGTTAGLSIVRLLLELGADPQARDDDGRTARDWADDTALKELSELLG